MGFAYDGDADRCIAVDGDGRVVDGDMIMYICGKYMKQQGTLVNNTVVTTIMSNFEPQSVLILRPLGSLLITYVSAPRASNTFLAMAEALPLAQSDTRRSSYMFEYSLVAGLTASGADVYLLHVTTTPSVSYVVRTEGFNCENHLNT